MENPAAHERTTGPEIWDQTEGRITHLVASAGTGGTISGISHFLKAQNPSITIVGADPEGSVLSGDVARPYLTEGVGEDFFPGTHDPAAVDRWVRVSDRDAFLMARRITREEGILAGESCGTAVVAVLDEARRVMDRDGAAASGRGDGRHPPGRRPFLPLQALQRRVDAGQRPPRHDRGGGPRRPAPRGPPPRAGPAGRRAGPDHRSGRRGDRHAPAVRDQPAAGVAGGRPATSWTASSGRSASEGLLDRAYRNPEIVERTVGEVMDRPLPDGRRSTPPSTRRSRSSRAAARRRSRCVRAARPG